MITPALLNTGSEDLIKDFFFYFLFPKKLQSQGPGLPVAHIKGTINRKVL